MPEIIYNSYTLPNVIEKFSFSKDEKAFSFSCMFLMKSSSASSLVNECQAAETALTEINKDFSLSFGGSAEFSFSHSANTGFLARPRLNKIKNKLATETSRPYDFSINIQLPFPQAGYNFRREGSFSISYDPSRRRTATFTCLYTAGGSDSALTKYVANAKTWATSVMTSLGGTWELVSENFREEHEQKILNGNIIYREIIANQSESLIDVGIIVDPQCTYSLDVDQAIGVSQAGFSQISRIRISVNYSCQVDKALLPAENDLETVYQDTVKPWLVKHSRDILGLANYNQAGLTYIIESERTSISPYNYRISGSLVFTAPRNFSSITELSESVTTTRNYAINSEKLWDGQDDTYNTWSLGGRKVAMRAITMTKLGSPPDDPQDFNGGGPGTWIKQNISRRTMHRRLGVGTGVPGASWVDAYVVSFTEAYIYVVPAQGGSIVGGE